MIQHGATLLISPKATWQRLANLDPAQLSICLIYPLIMAILPSVAWYYGTSQIGWTVGISESVIRLTEQSAFEIAILFYLVMVSSVAIIGYFIHWMSETYGADSTLTSMRSVISVRGSAGSGRSRSGRLRVGSYRPPCSWTNPPSWEPRMP